MSENKFVALARLTKKIEHIKALINEGKFELANEYIKEAIKYAYDNYNLHSYINELYGLQDGIITMIHSPKKKAMFSFSRLKSRRRVDRSRKSKSRRTVGKPRKSKSRKARRKSRRKSKSRRRVGRPRKSKSRRKSRRKSKSRRKVGRPRKSKSRRKSGRKSKSRKARRKSR